MAKVTTAGIADVVEEQLLNGGGPYKAQCYEASIYMKGPEDDPNTKKKLQINMVVLDGPEQRDGSSPDERRFADFLALDHYEDHKDQGKMAKQRLKNALTVFEVEHEGDEWDSDDFIEKVVLVRLKEGVNTITNEPTIQVAKYLPAPDEDF